MAGPNGHICGGIDAQCCAPHVGEVVDSSRLRVAARTRTCPCDSCIESHGWCDRCGRTQLCCECFNLPPFVSSACHILLQSLLSCMLCSHSEHSFSGQAACARVHACTHTEHRFMLVLSESSARPALLFSCNFITRALFAMSIRSNLVMMLLTSSSSFCSSCSVVVCHTGCHRRAQLASDSCQRAGRTEAHGRTRPRQVGATYAWLCRAYWHHRCTARRDGSSSCGGNQRERVDVCDGGRNTARSRAEDWPVRDVLFDSLS